MLRNRLFFIVIACAMLLLGSGAGTTVAAASRMIPISDDVSVELHDWSDAWDANQNNAYIDLMTGIINGQTEISIRGDYVNSTQLMNVVNRISRELSVNEGIYFDTVSYTDEGYADTVTISYSSQLSQEEIMKTFRKVADYTAFGKSFIDDTMTDLEKALFLHDYVSQRTFYTHYNSPLGYATGVFEKNIGTCANISAAYNEMLHWAGVPFGSASGTASENTLDDPHAWTVIYADGKWYVSDATFDSKTVEENEKYTPPDHGYFLRGTEEHYENYITSSFNNVDKFGYRIENVERKNPTAFWNFSDCRSNVAYHVNEGESHGKLYYLSPGSEPWRNVLTVRDSMSCDANVVTYPDCIYHNIAWAHDTLYGYRDNAIYVIDWYTHQETKIGYLEGNTYHHIADGSVQELEKEVTGISGILAENGKLSALVTYADDSTGVITADTYDRVEAFSGADWTKSSISGPSQEPSEIIYEFSADKNNFVDTKASVKSVGSTFAHPGGYEFPDYVCSLRVSSINEEAFKDCRPEMLGGELKFGKFIEKVCSRAFENCTGLSGTQDLSTIYFLEPYAFCGCTGIDKVVLCPERSMPANAFAGCSGVREFVNLETMSSIGESAFEGCTSLSSCLDFSEQLIIYDKAFKDCPNIELPAVFKASYIGSSAFENCSGINGAISIPNCSYLGDSPFANTGITRLFDTDQIWHVGASMLQGTQMEGILSFPAVTSLTSFAFTDAAKVTALRFPNPNTIEPNGNQYTFPESTDTALFIAKGSQLEELIRDKWTYGVNYWYVDDVIASGELENGVVWSIGGDGVMRMNVSDGVTNTVSISGYSSAPAPWDDYKKYVESLKVESSYIHLGSNAVCGFDNLRSVELAPDSSYDEDAFSGCGILSPDDIIIIKCSHEYGEWVTTVEPTCTREGTEERTCTKCGAAETRSIDPLGHDFEEWKVVIEPTEEEEGLERRFCKRGDDYREERTIPKLPHTHNIIHVEAAAATCTEEGNSEYWTCSKCGKMYADADLENEIATEETVIPAIGHKEVALPDAAATCTENGSVGGKKCSVCGEILEAPEVVEALGHDYQEVEGSAVAATCEKAGKKADQKCSRCEDVKEGAVIEALGHDWGEWTVVKEATEDEEGLERRICGRDDSHQEERAIPKLNHTHQMEKTEAVAATCTEDGNIEYWTCSKCGKIYSDENGENEITAKETIVKAKGHTEEEIPAVAATCTETGLTTGKKCSVCGEILKAQETVEALGHDYQEVEGSAVAATCEKAGKKADQKCSRCEDVKEGAVIEALGHDYQEVEGSAVAATCEKAGKKADQKCSRCEDVKEGAVIDALGHDWGEWTVVKEATEDEEGLERRVCGRDDSHKEERTIPKLNHTHKMEKTEAVAATCKEDGNIEYWTCGKCGRIYSDGNGENELNPEDTIVNAKGHVEEEIPAVAATCTETGLSAGKKCSVCGEILKAQETVEALGHDWEEPTYTWSKDNSSVTANHVCRNDGSHEETETVKTTAKVTKPATYAAKGQTTYTALFANPSFSQQSKTVTNIAKLAIKGTTISKVTPAKKGFTVKWKRGTGNTGYEIQYALNSKFTKSKKVVKVTKRATVSKKVSKLKAKKKYFVRIRTYKVYKGKKYYSKWSKARTVTTKK